MAKEYFVVTIVGPDRRGLVAGITDEITTYDANIEESHMSRLGGEFAVLMLLSLSNGNSQSLLAGLERLGNEQVKVFIKETNLARLKVFEGFVPYQISVIGADHEGIVNQVGQKGECRHHRGAVYENCEVSPRSVYRCLPIF